MDGWRGGCTGVRAGSLRASSQKSALIRIGRELKVERNCLVKLSSVIVLGVEDAR